MKHEDALLRAGLIKIKAERAEDTLVELRDTRRLKLRALEKNRARLSETEYQAQAKAAREEGRRLARQVQADLREYAAEADKLRAVFSLRAVLDAQAFSPNRLEDVLERTFWMQALRDYDSSELRTLLHQKAQSGDPRDLALLPMVGRALRGRDDAKAMAARTEFQALAETGSCTIPDPDGGDPVTINLQLPGDFGVAAARLASVENIARRVGPDLNEIIHNGPQAGDANRLTDNLGADAAVEEIARRRTADAKAERDRQVEALAKRQMREVLGERIEFAEQTAQPTTTPPAEATPPAVQQ